MTDDIMTRLTALAHPDAADAADEIARLRLVVDELADALVNTPCDCSMKCRCGRDAALANWRASCPN